MRPKLQVERHHGTHPWSSLMLVVLLMLYSGVCGTLVVVRPESHSGTPCYQLTSRGEIRICSAISYQNCWSPKEHCKASNGCQELCTNRAVLHNLDGNSTQPSKSCRKLISLNQSVQIRHSFCASLDASTFTTQANSKHLS